MIYPITVDQSSSLTLTCNITGKVGPALIIFLNSDLSYELNYTRLGYTITTNATSQSLTVTNIQSAFVAHAQIQILFLIKLFKYA